MHQTLQQQSNNYNYTALEATYHRLIGGELVRYYISIKSGQTSQISIGEHHATTTL